MPNPDRFTGLTEEEQSDYEWTVFTMFEGRYSTELESERLSIAKRMSRYLESLAASRATAARRLALLEEFEWIEQVNGLKYCPKCGREECYGHNDPCLLAAELRGGG